jgi:hypothetical protein
VTDIIRHELLYHEGGFWKDAGMNVLRPIFHKFTKFGLSSQSTRPSGTDSSRECASLSTPKNYQYAAHHDYRNINRMRLYHPYASRIAGPIDFRQFIIGQEEYDPQTLRDLLPGPGH